MPVDLPRLSETWKKPPSRAEWAQLEEAEMALGIDVAAHEPKAASGMLAYFLPAHEKPFAERTDAENETIREWRVRLNWYSALRRANIAPQFTEDGAKAKRQRVLPASMAR